MTVTFSIHYNTRWGENLILVALDREYPMSWSGNGIWELSLEATPAMLADYTYVVTENGIWTRTEWTHHHRKPGRARKLVAEDAWIDCPVAGCPFTREHSAPVFDRPGFRGAGTAVPVFSLRSDEGFGVGEFNDIPRFVDWLARTGQCVLQLLPINDTTRNGEWSDSYPYNPVSSFALHPIYIHLQDVGVEEDDAFRKLRGELNALPAVDYPRVTALKTGYLLRAFALRGKADMASDAFKAFAEENSSWLEPYAAFRAGRDGNGEDFHRWVQFHLDRQLSAAVAYAHSKGVYLKGDLPIGVGRDSVDAASFPRLFNLDSNAGAPPDYFSTDGQNWGFPTYNWDEMAKDGYAWWRARLRNMARFFDAYRIDHILGFFRIWEIPLTEKSGKAGHFNPALPYRQEELRAAGLPLEGLFLEDPRRKGWYHPLISPDTSALEPWQKERFDVLYKDFFYHRHNSFWAKEAMRKLPRLLSCTGMLACGEDLGMIPDCVPGVMEGERILSLEMQRMEKGRPWPRLAVAATSTHDMTSIRLRDGGDMDPADCERVLRAHLESEPILAVFPLQDWMSIDGGLRNPDPLSERINDPADAANKWRWRMHLTIDELLEKDGFSGRVAGLIGSSGRQKLPEPGLCREKV